MPTQERIYLSAVITPQNEIIANLGLSTSARARTAELRKMFGAGSSVKLQEVPTAFWLGLGTQLVGPTVPVAELIEGQSAADQVCILRAAKEACIRRQDFDGAAQLRDRQNAAARQNDEGAKS